LDQLQDVTAILGQEIPEAFPGDIPAEVVETLKTAKLEMRRLPAVVEELKAARETNDEFNEVIDRLLVLADEAAALPGEDQAGRDKRQGEFVALSQVVARLAGRLNYQGPKLGLAVPAQARGTYRILKRLLPVKAARNRQLDQQEALIVEALQETLNFLEIVAESYSDSTSLSGLPDLLKRVRWFRRTYQVDVPSEPVTPIELH